MLIERALCFGGCDWFAINVLTKFCHGDALAPGVSGQEDLFVFFSDKSRAEGLHELIRREMMKRMR